MKSGEEKSMIMIWNQREVFIGYPSEELKSIIDTLKANKIKYKCRAFSNNSAHLFNMKITSLDLFGLKSDPSRIYHVYVHIRDYDNAIAVLQND